MAVDSDQLTIFLAGGGTGGHLYPGIAVAEALRIVLPDAKVVFLCTNKEIDRVILEPTGFQFVPQPIGRKFREHVSPAVVRLDSLDRVSVAEDVRLGTIGTSQGRPRLGRYDRQI